MTHALSLILRIALVTACFVYALWGVDFHQFATVLACYNPWTIAACTTFTFVPYYIQGLRLNFLTDYTAGRWNCFKASIFCLGTNNIFPAKFGEVAKIFYLRRKSGLPVGKGLGLVFWERFFDLNFILIIGAFSALGLGFNLAVVPLAGVVGSIWACLIVIHLFPKVGDWAERMIPWQRPRLLCHDIISQIRDSSGVSFFLVLAAYSCIFWLANIIFFYGMLQWVGGLDLTLAQAITVFVVAGLGFAVPSSPGSLGVYEAVIVLALGWFGVPKESSLGIGLTIRFAMFIPTTLLTLLIMAKSGLSAKSIRNSEEIPS